MKQLKRQIFKKGLNHWIAGLLALAIASCGDRTLPLPGSWKTYENPRFDFEFPYPGNWVAASVPSNLDGRTFYHPQNPEVQVTVWGGYLPTDGSREISEVAPANFTTHSGVRGKLTVEVESEVTSVRLTLVDEGVTYHFEGRSPSETFADYYRLFYDMASQYRIGRAPFRLNSSQKGDSALHHLPLNSFAQLKRAT